MTPALAPAGYPTLASRTPRRPSRAELAAWSCAGSKWADTQRIALTVGPHLVGRYPPETPLAEVLADVARWAVEPGHMEALGWPFALLPWTWEPGEDVVISHAGRVLAVASHGPDGAAVIRRLDRA